MPNPIESLIYTCISSATAQAPSDLSKALAILWDTTVRRFAVDREDLKPYVKQEEKTKFLEVINKPLIYMFL